jgi:molybdate/tungstate transport system substrate-binding protein
MRLTTTYATRVTHGSHRTLTATLVASLTVAGTVALADGPTASAAAHARPAARHVTVDVIAAGSLDTVLSKSIDPAFKKATGDSVQLTTGGSGTDAAQIKNGVSVEDVFISAAPSENDTLLGAKNGNWESWYAGFAYSPDVLGYYPKSRFAHALKTKPWYEVITEKGFRLGRTVPSQDPGGILAHAELMKAAQEHPSYAAALRKLATESSDEYPEDTEEANILTGQLDGAFMYEADAISQKSPFVPLTGATLDGDYTVTLLNKAAHITGGEAFIKFLLGKSGQAAMRKDKFGITSPTQVKNPNSVPTALRSVVK